MRWSVGIEAESREDAVCKATERGGSAGGGAPVGEDELR